jgi:hypothetical protein
MGRVAMNYHVFSRVAGAHWSTLGQPPLLHRFAALVTAGTLVLAGSAGVLAQGATPTVASAFADLGLPELTITATSAGMTVDQAEIPAGRYLVHFVNETDEPLQSGGFVRLIAGHTLEELSWADELAAGTPIPEMGPTTEDDWLYETYLTGGGSTFSPEVVVDLPGGKYGVWADDPATPLPAAPLTVIGDPDATISGPAPEAAVTIVEEGAGGAGFHFTVQGDLKSGPQVVKVLNASDQPHFIAVQQYPEPVTVDQVMAAMAFDPSTGATPAPDMLDFNQMTFAGWVGAQSIGTTQWVTLDLQTGQAILQCFVTDPQAGEVPHAFEGMTDVVPVAAS